jgi:hypothetical protein
MPFANFGCFSFSPVSVRRNAPELAGVYGLSNGREWVFVGDADSIQAALLGHLMATETKLQSRAPTGFTFELCSSERLARKNRLVWELKPVCNPPLGQPSHSVTPMAPSRLW